jgi:hypothetical protein
MVQSRIKFCSRSRLRYSCAPTRFGFEHMMCAGTASSEGKGGGG